ncbi:MAG: 4-hydroxybutyrate CoA-transferase [Defluviitaleaceae bacterium]|nr:4-hydroxybutyrate CoA-transferase [Defluviitaleaceae bacterium]
MKGLIVMRWQDEYKHKICTADEAVKLVKSGDRVMPSHAAGEPKALMDALIRRAEELKNVEIWGGLNLSKGEYADPRYKDNLHINTTFASPGSRQAIWDERAFFSPIHFHKFPRLIRGGVIKCNGYFGHVSPPDKNGFVSFGVSVDIARACLDSCDYSVALVNEQMPRTPGDTLVHISKFDKIVECDEPLYVRAKVEADDPIMSQIGKNIAGLIEDGSCLQMGQGKIPDAILINLNDKKDLGIHTEVFSDNLIPLIEKGIITGARKTLDTRKIVATFIQGTKTLYDYVNNNLTLQMMPVDYTNNPCNIAQQDRMVAINAALEVDLTGQVAAETMGHKQYSGIGGQLDFLRGAAASKGGKPIVTLPSTAKGGTISRISAVLKAGTAITTTRNDIHWVVTEHGAVNLVGRSIHERAKLLISIAEPKFREQLERDFAESMKQHHAK